MLFLGISSIFPGEKEDADKFFKSGLSKIDQKKFKDAIPDFDKCIELIPSYAEAYINRGIAKYKTDDFQGSIEDYNKSEEIDPELSLIYIKRGESKQAVQDYSGAREDYDKYFQKVGKENHPIVLGNRGYVKFKLGDIEGAMEDYNKALKIDPNNAQVYLNRAGIYMDRGNYKAAHEDYNSYIKKMGEKNHEILWLRASTRYEIKDFKGALSDLDKAIKLNSQKVEYFYYRALVKEELKDLKGSLKDFDIVLSKDPSHIAIIYRANIKFKLKDYKGSISDYDAYIKSGQTDLLYKAYVQKGASEALMKDLESGLDDCSKGLKINPDYAEGYFWRGIIYIDLADKVTGCADLKRSMDLNFTAAKNHYDKFCK